MNINDYLNKIKSVAENLKSQGEEIDVFVNELRLAKNNGLKVFVCGNGGSASNASHFACDLFKISGIKTICLNDNIPLMTAIINDNGWDNVFVDQLKRVHKCGDMLIVISVHGGKGKDKAGKWSQNINKAVDYVNSNGGITMCFTGFDGGWLKNNCDVCIVVPVDSTPLVESFHSVLHHYIAFELYEGNRK